MSAPITVGTEPRGMAFDGTYIWVTNYGSNSLSKIMATTGVVINTYNFVSTVCEAPWGIAYDGAYLWLACSLSGTVVKFNPVNGSASPIQLTGFAPSFIAYDGETNQAGGPFVWITSASTTAGVIRIGTTTLAISPIFDSGSQPTYGIVFDGLYLWVGNGNSNSVTKLLQSTGTVVGTYPTGGPAVFLGFDGGNVWVANRGAGTLSKM